MTQRQSQVKLLNIHEFAKLCQTTPRTLRFYEEKGLFKPTKIDTYNNYRYYSPDQFRKIRKIKLYQHLGLSLESIVVIINYQKSDEYFEEELSRLRREVIEKQKELRFVSAMKPVMSTSKQNLLESRMLGPFHLLSITIPHGEYSEIDQYLNQLIDHLSSLDLPSPVWQVVFYHDWSENPIDTKLEVCFAYEDISTRIRQQLPDQVLYRKFPKTQIHCYEYKGPYEYITLVYQKLNQEIERNKLKWTLPVFDLHHKITSSTSEFEYTTLLCFPIA
jgi:DNA-binding transcriptional MerR regulator